MIVEDSMKTIYNTSDVLKVLDLEWGRLRTWIKSGFFIPMIPPKGQGRAFEFTLWDIYALAIFKKLIDGGISRWSAGKSIEILPKLMKTRWDGKKPLFISVKVSEESHNTSIEEPSWLVKSWINDEENTNWDRILIINFQTLKKSVDNKLKELEE